NTGASVASRSTSASVVSAMTRPPARTVTRSVVGSMVIGWSTPGIRTPLTIPDDSLAFPCCTCGVVDLDALAAAGIKDAAARRRLLEYLEALGFTADEMVAAEDHGRLFALAGDGALRSGRPVHSLRSAAAAIGRPLDDVQHAWAALGLTVEDVDKITLSE